MTVTGKAEAEVSRRPASRRAFHPPLLAIVPVLLVYAPNSGFLPPSSLLRPLGMMLLLGLVLWAVATAVLRSPVRGATFASLFLAGLFAYSWVAGGLPLQSPGMRQAVFFGFVTTVAAALAWRIRDPGVLNVFSAVLLGLSLLQNGVAFLGHRGGESGQVAAGGRKGTQRPDVYYIVLDGYGRHDAMKEKLGYDDAFFVNGLRDLGFYVADRSRTNYVQTELSLASSLNMEHLQTLFPEPDRSGDRRPFDRLITNSAVAKTFQAQGYRFLTVTTGFPAIEFRPENATYAPVGGLSLLETALLELTPLRERSEVWISQFNIRREWLTGAFGTLGSLAGESGEPKFVFAHILAPHPPFVFDAEGRPTKVGNFFGYYDGSDWIEHNGDADRYQKGFRGQATWTARQTLQVVRRLISSRRPPIIIVQGDHGPKSRLNQNSLAETDLQECVPILNAYFVPPEIRRKLDPGITPVNSFRVVLGTLFGLDLPRRPDRSYFSPFARPMEFTEVTDQVH